MGWQFEMLHPAGLAALALLPLLGWLARGSLTGLTGGRQRAMLAARLAVVLLAAAALADVRITRPDVRRMVVVAVDESASIAPAGRETARKFLDELMAMRGDDTIVRLPFAGKPGAVERSGDAAAEPPEPLGTDLDAALEAARAAVPADYIPRIVLLSDGNSTSPRPMAAFRSAKGSAPGSVPVFTVPLASKCDPEVYVQSVECPGQVSEGDAFAVDVTIHASRDDQGNVQLLDAGRPVHERKVRLTSGENRVRIAHRGSSTRLVALAVRLSGFRDTIAQNNEAGALVCVAARPKVLLIESEPRLVETLSESLREDRIDVELRPHDGLPRQVSDLVQYEAVLLSNVPAGALSDEQMASLEAYVRDLGGGLIAVGGDQSFTPGGYRDTLLEQILPVRCEAEPQEERRAFAMVLVLDCSHSMHGRPLELAKEAARRAIGLLDPRDEVGILAFEDAARWISPLRPCGDKKRLLAEIETLGTGLGTDLYSAMDRAALALEESFAEVKHMVVLSDGMSHPNAFEPLTERIAAAGITISIVAMGQGVPRPFLEGLASLGHGNLYFCDDASSIPRVFALETASASRLGIIEKPAFARLVGPSPAVARQEIEGAPSLLGYVETRAKPGSQVVLASDRGHPLLAWWRYGQGVSMAFTSDVQSRWATGWLQWPGFQRFWRQLVRQAMRRDRSRDFLLGARRCGEQIEVFLDAVDAQGRYLNGAEGRMTVARPGDSAGSEAIAMSQAAPGRYAARFAADPKSPCAFEVSLYPPRDKPGAVPSASPVKMGRSPSATAGRPAYLERRALAACPPEELCTRPANLELLRSIAEATGGQFEARPEAVLSPADQSVPRTVCLWPWLLAAALAAWLVDLALRRTGRPPDETI